MFYSLFFLGLLSSYAGCSLDYSKDPKLITDHSYKSWSCHHDEVKIDQRLISMLDLYIQKNKNYASIIAFLAAGFGLFLFPFKNSKIEAMSRCFGWCGICKALWMMHELYQMVAPLKLAAAIVKRQNNCRADIKFLCEKLVTENILSFKKLRETFQMFNQKLDKCKETSKSMNSLLVFAERYPLLKKKLKSMFNQSALLLAREQITLIAKLYIQFLALQRALDLHSSPYYGAIDAALEAQKNVFVKDVCPLKSIVKSLHDQKELGFQLYFLCWDLDSKLKPFFEIVDYHFANSVSTIEMNQARQWIADIQGYTTNNGMTIEKMLNHYLALQAQAEQESPNKGGIWIFNGEAPKAWYSK
jgi:hypothetical protein